jgi:SAM-dependent methyltransferase
MNTEFQLDLPQLSSKRFKQFPKTRPALPAEFEAIYEQSYKTNREGNSAATGLAQRMEAWMHRKVAEDLTSKPQITLEIGAGTLNHLAYEPHNLNYDIIEPFSYLYEGSKNLRRVRRIFSDIADVPLISRYDRIISIATFEHICDLPQVIAKAGGLLSPDGHLRVAIPSEGTILWSLGWHLTTGLEFRWKHNLDYAVLMQHEHVNTASEIEEVLCYFFDQVEDSVLGITKSLSFYQFYDCTRPNLNRCFSNFEADGV